MAFGIDQLRQGVETLTRRVDEVLAKQLGDLAKTVQAGFTETRNQVVDAIANARTDLGDRIEDNRRSTDKLTSEVNAARREIAELHAAVQGWRADAASNPTPTPAAQPAPATPDPAPQPAPAPPTPEPTPHERPPQATTTAEPHQLDSEDHHTRHLARMLDAASIAKAQLTCHRDLWDFLVKNAADQPHFHIPGEVQDDQGNIHVTLSGPSIAAALTAMWETRHHSRGQSPTSVDWALANEIYEATATAVADVRGTARPRQHEHFAITINRTPPTPHTPDVDDTID